MDLRQFDKMEEAAWRFLPPPQLYPFPSFFIVLITRDDPGEGYITLEYRKNGSSWFFHNYKY